MLPVLACTRVLNAARLSEKRREKKYGADRLADCSEWIERVAFERDGK